MADLEKIGLDGSDFTIPAGGATAGVTTFNGRNGAVVPQSGDYSAALVGLGNVDNTSDADKPVSTATQAALDLKANAADMTTALAAKADTASLATVATSGSYNDLSDKPTIPAAYTLPTASAGELGGVKVGSGLSISAEGVLSTTGGGGGGTAGVETFNGRTGTVTPQNGDYTAAMVGLGNVDNTSDANKPISTATQAALDGKADAATVAADMALKANTADLATVATSGAYADLTGTPTIPAALNDLTDVSASAPVAGQVLTFGSGGVWAPQTNQAAGFPGLAALDWQDFTVVGGAAVSPYTFTGRIKVAKFQNQVWFRFDYDENVVLSATMTANWAAVLRLPSGYVPAVMQLGLMQQYYGGDSTIGYAVTIDGIIYFKSMSSLASTNRQLLGLIHYFL